MKLVSWYLCVDTNIWFGWSILRLFFFSAFCIYLPSVAFSAHDECLDGEQFLTSEDAVEVLIEQDCIVSNVPPQEYWFGRSVTIPIASGVIECAEYEISGLTGLTRNLRQGEELGVAAEVSNWGRGLIEAKFCSLYWSPSH